MSKLIDEVVTRFCTLGRWHDSGSCEAGHSAGSDVRAVLNEMFEERETYWNKGTVALCPRAKPEPTLAEATTTLVHVIDCTELLSTNAELLRKARQDVIAALAREGK